MYRFWNFLGVLALICAGLAHAGGAYAQSGDDDWVPPWEWVTVVHPCFLEYTPSGGNTCTREILGLPPEMEPEPVRKTLFEQCQERGGEFFQGYCHLPEDDIPLPWEPGYPYAHQNASLVHIGDRLNAQSTTADQNSEISANRDAVIQLTQVAATQQAALVARQAQMESSFNNRFDEVSTGVALAMALSAPALSGNKRFSLSGGFGHFDSNSAVGATGLFRLNQEWLFSIGGGTGLEKGVVGVKAVVTREW